MAKCSKIQKKKRQVCIGDMKDEITIQARNIKSPPSDGVDFVEEFTGDDVVWAAVNTKSGVVFFDGTNQEVLKTHEIYIRYLQGVTAEAWVLFKGSRYDVLQVDNLEERDEFMRLDCTNRGTTANKANSL